MSSSPDETKQKEWKNTHPLGLLSTLPDSILADIFSFSIASIKDLARTRLISKHIYKRIIPILPTSLNYKIVQCCYHDESTSFVTDLLNQECLEHDYEFRAGETWHVITSDGEDMTLNLFPGCVVKSVLFLDRDCMEMSGSDDDSDDETANQSPTYTNVSEQDLWEICKRINESKTVTELVRWQKEAFRMDAFSPNWPPSYQGNEDDSDDSNAEIHEDLQNNGFQMVPAMLTLIVPEHIFHPEIKKGMEMSTSKDIVKLKAISYALEDPSEILVRLDACFTARIEDDGKYFNGYIQENRQILVPMYILYNDCDLDEIVYDMDLTSLVLSSLCNDHFAQNVKEGVAIIDGIVSDSLRQQLKETIDLFASESAIDYHPYSKNVVRDLVHPALFSYVKDVTPLVCDVKDTLPCQFFSNQSFFSTNDTNKDFWGRKYENSNYQWLPTYFDISPNGRCKILDYINNLVPRSKYSNLYDLLEILFQQALPFFEVVYSYVRRVKPLIRHNELHDDPYDNFDDELKNLRSNGFTSLRGQQLQIITKIVDYELSSNSQLSYEGVWHVEGMSHEEIVATGLYILDRDGDIEGGSLLFQRSFLRNECSEFFHSVPQCRHPHLENILSNGLSPLGMVETLDGRLIVFPNSHVHKVTMMKKVLTQVDESEISRRRIIVFFLVNPEKRIISTREVEPQQEEVGGFMTREEAFRHRLNLMEERKYTKQDWNVREIELCEH